MNAKQIEHIEAYIEEFDQSNPVDQYVPIRDNEDYVYIFGVSFGVVLIPENDGRITFTILTEDDGQYFINDNPLYAHNAWLLDLSHCLNIAQEYIKQNATQSYYKNSDVKCGYELPYKSKEDEITEFFTLPESILND